MPNSLSTHISSVVAVVIAVLTGLDKSLTISATDKTVIIAVLVAGAGALQLAHVGLKAKALAVYGDVSKVVRSVEAKLPASVDTDVNQIADQVVSEVKTAVDTAATPTLSDLPETPITS